ncbi:TIGR01212 family radical SAM protein [Clostridium sp.]|uniref:TIGR01212 family radical SAM protein n=1 Tax=Clostridium sp. TaxID=1506 RepID=UPI001A4F035D|nr:TIGR01212 family radical SAM protein [Clostridium sp.]MBK5239706.1 TIGR01212 family radical SAM protein [Clostridium sp.]
MQKAWGDKRYHSLNYFLREKFYGKVFKISLDGGFSCPNRDGTISSGGCLFCSERGSGDFAGNREFTIKKQFEDIKDMMSKKWKSEKYIAYFQAYTSTYGPIELLRAKYDEAVLQEGVVALAIATRPDCLDDDVLDLIEEYSHRIYTWIELGLQTCNDESAKIINRGYKLSKFEEALENLNERNIDVVVHTIFGLPGESTLDMLKTIDYVASKDIKGIKMHLLHLIEHTPMTELYKSGKLKFLEQEEYIDTICTAITRLPPNMVIHRLTGDAPRELLIGPMWSLKKWEVLNGIDNKLKELDIYQGVNFKI